MTIGFIGCGNMAQPIIRSLIEKGLYAKNNVYVYDTDTEKMNTFCEANGTNATQNEDEIIRSCETVFLCIKPQGFVDLFAKTKTAFIDCNPFVVSIAAGKEIAFIENHLSPALRIGRVFPNLNASVCQSASAYCINTACTQTEKELLGNIVSCFGSALFYPETLFSQFGVLGGCTPAYTFMYIDSLAKAAEKNGVSKEVARSTAIQSVLGSALYMQQSGIDPEILINRVCSKGGTTIEGVTSLRNADLQSIVCTAYEASLRRDKELSQN